MYSCDIFFISLRYLVILYVIVHTFRPRDLVPIANNLRILQLMSHEDLFPFLHPDFAEAGSLFDFSDETLNFLEERAKVELRISIFAPVLNCFLYHCCEIFCKSGWSVVEIVVKAI